MIFKIKFKFLPSALEVLGDLVLQGFRVLISYNLQIHNPHNHQTFQIIYYLSTCLFLTPSFPHLPNLDSSDSSFRLASRWLPLQKASPISPTSALCSALLQQPKAPLAMMLFTFACNLVCLPCWTEIPEDRDNVLISGSKAFSVRHKVGAQLST